MKKKLFILLLIVLGLFLVLVFKDKKKVETKNIVMEDLTLKDLTYAENYAKENGLELIKEDIYVDNFAVGSIYTQSITKGKKIKKGDTLKIEVVAGSLEDKRNNQIKVLNENKVNELGRVPIMMYHGIHNKKNAETAYTGGNVDKDGYQRTAEAFRADLEFYYQNNYRMIRLNDYVDGKIDVALGKSPLILTFDDGLANNINVLGLDEKGNLIIDENSAVGILEEFKKKYPDFNVTATFFVNAGLFNQTQYNDKILNFLIDNGYDIGNHTLNHPDFTKISADKSNNEVGGLYSILDSKIAGKYVNIVALPYGSPYKENHANFKHILSSSYEGKTYSTKSTLRVGWEAETSPFNKNFNSLFLKRIRAYDNNGVEFDIEMNFKLLENNRFISDGDVNTISYPNSVKDNLDDKFDLEIFEY
jgi:peptidoglycan/xylan/chitin deacetylase (PgdA/CDA1 family)